MSKKGPSQTPTNTPVDNDRKTLDLIREVRRRKTEIEKAERPNWRTNCSFTFSDTGSGPYVNLHVESSIITLVNILGFLLVRDAYYEEAREQLGGVEVPGFTWQGFTLTDWREDIKTRLVKLQIASKRKKLETLEARLNAIVSPELRARLELEAIANELD